jgi:hypothetical protein
MMKIRWQRLRAVLVAVIVVAGAVPARANDDGLVMRAVGFFVSSAAGGGGTCTIPSATSGIPVSSDVVSLSNAVVYPTSTCDGYVELQNVMTSQGINVERMNIKLRIAGANRFRQYVPTRNGFPTACRNLRKATIYTGAHLFPVGTPPDYGNTGAGVGHLAFVQLLPMVDAQVFSCLREQYSGLPASVYVSLPLVIRVVGHGTSDSGQSITTNPIEFTLTLLHLCGNGRVDDQDGETCDPNAPDTCAVGPCDLSANACRNNLSLYCQTDADCAGQCIQEGDPNECSCLYGGG